jgi:putative flippase GtrA
MREYALGYTLTGGLAAGVDIGGFHWLAPRLQPLLLAAALSFVLAAMVNYTLSSLWVYRCRWRSMRRAALFLGFACVGLGVNAGVTWWLASTLPLHATLAKVGGVATAFGINFWMNTRLVFARAGPSQASP